MELVVESVKLQDITEKIETRLQDAECKLHEADGMLEVISRHGRSTVRSVDFHNGFSLSSINLLFDQDLILKFDIKDNPVYLVYCLEGFVIYSSNLGAPECQVKPGQVIIYAVKKGERPLLKLPAYQKLKLVGLQIVRQQFFANKSTHELSHPIRQILEDTASSTSYFYHGQFGSTLAACLVRVVSNRKSGFIGELLLEAKGLEILGLQLDQYAKETLSDAH